MLAILAMCVIGLGVVSGIACGGNPSGGPGEITNASNYVVTITGNGGSARASTSVTVTLEP